MGRTEEKHIYFFEWMCVGKDNVSFAQESAMHGCNRLAGIARGMYEFDAHLRMVDEQT